MKNVDIVEYFQTSYDNDDKIVLKNVSISIQKQKLTLSLTRQSMN